MPGSDIMQSTPKTSGMMPSLSTFDDNPGPRKYNFGGIEDDMENRENYRLGGYHPVHLGDTFGDDRYRVIHKLGHGGFATVWLCHDIVTLEYVALKIIIAVASSEHCPEVKELRLKDLDSKQAGGDKVVIPKDHFWVNGPNGTHLCVVLPLLGPSVSSIWFRHYDPANISRKVAPQMVQGIAFLHSNGICHGDFRPANILLQLSNFENLSEEQLIEVLGEPSLDEVLTASGELPGRNAPEYLVRAIEFDEIDRQYIKDEICIIDFGESYEPSSPPEWLGIPAGYRSPELIIDNTKGIASDIWALACTLYEIRAGSPLFENFFGTEDDVVDQMEMIFGTLPEPWRKSWAEQCEKPCEEDDASDTPTGEVLSVKGFIKKYLGEGYHFMIPKTWEKISYTISENEIEVLADLLERMLGGYDPGARMSARSALEHPWFSWDPTEDEKEQENIVERETTQDGDHDQPGDKKCENNKEQPEDSQAKEISQDQPGNNTCENVKQQPEDNRAEEISQEQLGDNKEQPEDIQKDENMPDQSVDGGGTPVVNENSQQEGAEELWDNQGLFRRNLARLVDEMTTRKLKRRRSV